MRMTLEPRSAEAISGALFAWFSPAFPTGGFAYSQGLETAVAEGLVGGEADLADWIEDVLMLGAGWSDAVMFALAHRAVRNEWEDTLPELAELSAALATSRERWAETLGQGEAFLAAVRTGWPGLAPPSLPARTTYGVAAGAATARLGAAPQMALSAYVTGIVANLIAASIRLGVCGQSGGVRVLATLGPTICDLAIRAADAEEQDLGGCALGADIAGMRHETLNGRLFLS
jgi:urease accessory protein